MLVAGAVVIVGGAGPLGAQTDGGSTDPTVSSLRQQADAASGAYFTALARYETLSTEIGQLEGQLPGLHAQESARAHAAVQRAVAAYEGAGSRQLGALIGSGDVLSAARQVEWLRILNGQDERAVVELQRSEAKLHDDERTLRAEQQDAAGALSSVQAQGAAIEAKLSAAETRANQLAAAAAAAAAPTAAPTAAPAPSSGGAPAPNPAYSPTPGENPHHNDPFLVCTRARESGGNYGAVNPAGPYMGAYQFLQATWDSAANHAGRSSLVGVPPNAASEYDQDDIAWDLYQWQGAGPWGGACT